MNDEEKMRPNREDLIRALVEARYPGQGFSTPSQRTPTATLFAGALEQQPLHVLRALAASHLQYERAEREKKEHSR